MENIRYAYALIGGIALLVIGTASLNRALKLAPRPIKKESEQRVNRSVFFALIVGSLSALCGAGLLFWGFFSFC